MSAPGRRLYRILSTILILVAAVGVVVLPNPLTPSVGPTTAAPSAVRWTDVNPLGATFFLNREVESWKKEVTVRLAAEAGIGWIHQMFPWEEIEPRPGYYWNDDYRRSTWDKFDEIVSLAQQYRMRIIARLDKPPKWALAEPGTSSLPVAREEDFANFVRTVVARYKGQIQHFQIWNEPNLAAEWNNQDVDPAAYARLLAVAAKAAREVNPDAVIISAPLAQTLEQGPRNLDDITFLEGMYQAGAQEYFDILGANAYGFEQPPTAPPDPNVLNFQRVRLLRDVMVRYGDEATPVWLNEFGWNAAPPDFPADLLHWRRVTDQQQAEYTAEGIRLAKEWGWVGVIGIWFFRQVGDYPATDSTYFFRMVDVDFTPRPVYHTIKALAEDLNVARPGEHEVTSAAVSLGPGWSTHVDPNASGGTVLAGVPAAPLVITFEGSELAANIARADGATALRVRLDSISSLPLSSDSARTQRVSIAPAGPEQGARVILGSGLPEGRHTIEVAVDPAGCQGDCVVWVDSFEVGAAIPSYVPFYAAVALLLVGIAGLVVTRLSARRS